MYVTVCVSILRVCIRCTRVGSKRVCIWCLVGVPVYASVLWHLKSTRSFFPAFWNYARTHRSVCTFYMYGWLFRSRWLRNALTLAFDASLLGIYAREFYDCLCVGFHVAQLPVHPRRCRVHSTFSKSVLYIRINRILEEFLLV